MGQKKASLLQAQAPFPSSHIEEAEERDPGKKEEPVFYFFSL
jgi:hypothetical protein